VCGKLQFASPRRPDILYTLKELGRRLQKPRECDWRLLKHLTRYLQGTRDLVMVMQCNGDTARVIGQSDSDWAGCRSTRKSTMCGIVVWAGIPITMFSRTQSVVALSSPESEYYGGCAVASECLYVRTILDFWGYRPSIEIQLDASSAIAIGNRHGLGKVRHMEVKYLWLQQLVATKHVRLVKVRGTEHPPDMGTKHLARESLEKCRRTVGLRRLSEVGVATVGWVVSARTMLARMSLAMILLAAGSSAQEVTCSTAAAMSPETGPPASSTDGWTQVGSALLLAANLAAFVVVTIALCARRPQSRRGVDASTQTDLEVEPRPNETWTHRQAYDHVLITPFGRRAHTRSDCPTLARSSPTSYAFCLVCQGMSSGSGQPRAIDSPHRRHHTASGSGQPRAYGDGRG